jgi:hypothetical protein
VAGRTVVLGAVLAALVSATALGAARHIGPAGVDGVRLGATYTHLRERHLVGRIHRGCELAPNTRSARLRSPLKGSVDFTRTSPRRVASITVRGGATARGVGIGGTIAEIRAAYPGAKINHRTDSTLGVTLVTVPKRAGGRLQFGVDTRTHEVTLIGVPFIPFCE